MCEHLQIPESFSTPQRDRVFGWEGMCIMLYRLSFPIRYTEMRKIFGRSNSALARIFLWMVDFVHDKWSSLIYMNKPILQQRLEEYCSSIASVTGLPTNVYGFIDGTKVEICRPKSRVKGQNLQKLCYSGHKRIHCLNFQGVTTPDGLCIHFSNPIEGCRHDTTLLTRTALLEVLKKYDFLVDKLLYGDPAYGLSDWIMCGFKGNNLSFQQEHFNSTMSSVRTAVEWNFGLAKSLWQQMNYYRSNKINLTPVGKIVKVCILLTNCHTCYFGGNQISDFFDMKPPSLKEYLDVTELLE
jgi:hypothetical protein